MPDPAKKLPGNRAGNNRTVRRSLLPAAQKIFPHFSFPIVNNCPRSVPCFISLWLKFAA